MTWPIFVVKPDTLFDIARIQLYGMKLGTTVNTAQMQFASKSISIMTLLSAVALVFALDASLQAEVKLPNVLGSHMVLQRDVPLKLWGTADVGEVVTVKMGDETQTATADDNGKWGVQFKPQKADAKGRSIVISGNNKIVLENILIGEVWIGSGQSNMEWQLKSSLGAGDAIKAADHAGIRLFHVPKKQTPAPADDVNAAWKVCTPESVPAFSGVLYFYGRRLHEELDVPVGLINSSWGGSPIEPWTIADGKSGGMYNAMIAPLTNFAVQGSIWYQGETNVLRNNGLAYTKKMSDLISGWRTAFDDDEHAFYFVQIAPWEGRYGPGELPALWEAQVATLKLPATGMAVTTDLVDNIKDIHPKNKLDVGERLARWALAKSYGKEDIVYSGPLYKSMAINGSKIAIEFAHTADGLKSRDGKPLNEFQIAGEDGKFVPATAEVDGKSVVVHAEGVSAPKHVRFGWHATSNPNLVNSEGLPASPFQTNNWTGGTGE
jgi:sialate O-acetylesterase